MKLLSKFILAAAAVILVLPVPQSSVSADDVCADNVYKSLSSELRALDDLPQNLPPLGDILPPVPEWADAPHRIDALSSMPIADLIVAPGHRILDDPSKIKSLTAYIKSSKGGDFSNDKILLNIVTDDHENIQAVDIWNAHHRLVAYVEAGYKTLGQLPTKNFEVLVNGKKSNGEEWVHYLPAAGLDLHRPGLNPVPVPASATVREGTVSVSGHLSNHELGSRTSVEALRQSMKSVKKRKIGVYFGTFDPIHEGHVDAVKAAIEELGLDEVLLLPNVNPLHKPGATAIYDRAMMIVKRIENEPKLNLFVDDSSKYIAPDGDNSVLIDRVKQIYATKEVVHIMGVDSYETLLKLNQITEHDNRSYFVLPRGAQSGDSIEVPDYLKGKVKVAKNYKDRDLSSTLIRNMVTQGQVPPANILAPSEYNYIKSKNIYSH